MNRGTTLVFGGQVGSEGKGAIVGYLARRQRWDAAICTFMTNAGHTWLGDNGEKVVVQQLPMAVVGQDVGALLLAPGSAITLSQLEKEINELENDYNVTARLKIHPRAVIITDEHVEYEKYATKYLGSTSKGCGAALAVKAMRKQHVILARDIGWLRPFLLDTTAMSNYLLENGGKMLIEGSQGFDLDINHGIEYPYCTSRGTTPQQVLADCGIHPNHVQHTIAVLRTYPIRVGNVVENGVQVGFSGNFGGRELDWSEVTKRSGSPVPLEERTTVTQRVRRVFEMDFERLKYMHSVCKPTEYALTFADYIDYRLTDKTSMFADGVPDEARAKTWEFIAKLEETVGHDMVSMLKTGAKDSALIDMQSDAIDLFGFSD